MPESQPPSEMQQPLSLTEELKVQKLRLEIDASRRPFFKKVSFWGVVVVPMVLGQGWTINGWLNGDWDERLQSLEEQKNSLEVQETRLRYLTDLLGTQNRSLKSERETAESQVKNLESDRKRLSSDNDNLEAKISGHRETIRKLNAQAGEFRESAEAALRGLQRLSRDTDALFEGKIGIFHDVQESGLRSDLKEKILSGLRGLLDVIRTTEKDVNRVQRILKQMTENG